MMHLPCKNCGSLDLRALYRSETGERWVGCDNCGNASKPSTSNIQQELVAQWNREQTVPAQPATQGDDVWKNLEQTKVFKEVLAERNRQDEKWGGSNHDDQHPLYDFAEWIIAYATWARMVHLNQKPEEARKRMIQVAALAIAAVESMDRKNKV